MQSHGDPLRLACYPNGPNTKGTKFSPSLLNTSDGGFLFYSGNHDGVAATGSQDIFVSELRPDGSYGPGVPVTSLNTTFEDQQPNVSWSCGRRSLARSIVALRLCREPVPYCFSCLQIAAVNLLLTWRLFDLKPAFDVECERSKLSRLSLSDTTQRKTPGSFPPGVFYLL
jgi:hypothetical protein